MVIQILPLLIHYLLVPQLLLPPIILLLIISTQSDNQVSHIPAPALLPYFSSTSANNGWQPLNTATTSNYSYEVIITCHNLAKVRRFRKNKSEYLDLFYYQYQYRQHRFSIIIITCSWGLPNLPKQSIHSRSLARWVGGGEVGITGYQPKTYAC